MKQPRLVVIGNGMAGARAVEEILARGGRGRFEIAVFGAEPYGNYNRILLSSVLSGAHEPHDIFINPLEWYREHGIRLHAGVPVERIDRQEKRVYGAGGVVEAYDTLIIATGSSSFVPPLQGLYDASGAFKEGVFVFRTLDDCAEIARYAKRSTRAAVIGGGLLGLEAARGLLTHGVEVHVVHLAPHLMDVQLDATAGTLLRRTLEQLGVRTHLERVTSAVRGEDRVEGLDFKDNTSLACDMIVVSCGIRANVGLAQACGLSVERGIVVDDQMRSPDDPNVYAVGECAQHRGQVYGLVAPVWEQAQVLAAYLTGQRPDAAYRGSKLSTKLKVMGVDLASMGEKDARAPDDEVVQYSEPTRGIYKKLVVRDGRLAGAILLGDTVGAASLIQAFDRGTPLPVNRADVLFPGPRSDAARPDVSQMPDDAQICNCNGVSKGQIRRCIEAGNRTVRAVGEATRAGTGCGSCKPLVQAIVEAAGGDQSHDDPSVHYYVPAIPLAKPDLIQAIRQRGLKSVSAVFQALGNGTHDPASKAGLASLLKTIWGADYEDERDARYINDRVHANIQRDSTFSVVPRIYGGVTNPEQLRRIADVAEKYKVPMLKITGGQRIDLLGIPKEQLPEVWRDLGMASGHAYTKAFRTCKTCVGSDFCRYGLGDSTALGIAIEKRFQGVESPHKMKLATAGCPRNCSEATTKDVGAVAIEGGKWEIYVGGAAGSRVRKGDLLVVVESHSDVLRYTGRFMQYYRENAKYQERTYDFVERVGIETLRRLLVEDADGVCARLDAEIQEAVDAYRDPWREAEAPIHPNQFATTLVS